MSKIEALTATLQSGSLYVQKDGQMQPVPPITEDDYNMLVAAVHILSLKDDGSFYGSLTPVARQWSADNREAK